MPKIVILDGYTTNPGDLSWEKLEALGDLIVYDLSLIHISNQTFRTYNDNNNH